MCACVWLLRKTPLKCSLPLFFLMYIESFTPLPLPPLLSSICRLGIDFTFHCPPHSHIILINMDIARGFLQLPVVH